MEVDGPCAAEIGGGMLRPDEDNGSPEGMSLAVSVYTLEEPEFSRAIRGG